MHPLLGKVLYAGLFVLVLPLALLAWAAASAPNVHLPAVHSVPVGASLALGGALIMGWGQVSLTVYGGGLPMNAYPPPRFVSRGIYGLVGDPIYLGFGMLCVGLSVALGSASGLWLVSPVTILATVALVLGYERIDLRKRFGPTLPQPLLSLPADEDAAASASERAGIYLLVVVPWLVLREWLSALGTPSDAVVAYLPLERNWPVLGWTAPLYASIGLWVVLAPLVAPSRRVLREFAIRGGIATLLMPLLVVTVPLISPPRPLGGEGAFGNLLLFERSVVDRWGTFPAWGVLWVLLAMAVFVQRMPRARAAWWLLGGAVSLSAITTGTHALVDVIAAVALAVALMQRQALWEFLRRSSEWFANSWQEWQFGPIRVINHGIYAALGGAVGLLIAGSLLGERAFWSLAFVTISLVACAALWAQVVEGSPSLLRPYGFYGALLGGILGCILARPLFGTDPWLLLGACSVAAPLIQAFGRIRCLVQGCCHGREAPASIGICHRHPRSRVCRLSTLAGVPVHPTPLYSILCNVAITPVLVRLWFAAAPLSLIAGVYFILNGLGRFVEEAYRGEPQTLVLRGLRFYQWMAIVSVVGGAVLTCVPSHPAPPDLFQLSGPLLVLCLSMGAVLWLAYGVDFPWLNRRFARLV